MSSATELSGVHASGSESNMTMFDKAKHKVIQHNTDRQQKNSNRLLLAVDPTMALCPQSTHAATRFGTIALCYTTKFFHRFKIEPRKMRFCATLLPSIAERTEPEMCSNKQTR